jgi:hypothetical protein
MGWTALAAGDQTAARRSFEHAVTAYEEVGSPRGTGLALMGLAAVEAAAGRAERAVTIAASAQVLSERAGVVVEHPMDPGVVGRIEALKASIPQGTLADLMASAGTLSPTAVLARRVAPGASAEPCRFGGVSPLCATCNRGGDPVSHDPRQARIAGRR